MRAKSGLSSLSFSGDQIRTAQSELGTLVTVTARQTIDAGSTTFTLIVPDTRLDASRTAAIATHGIIAVHRLSIAPSQVAGQKTAYSFIALTGTATHVLF